MYRFLIRCLKAYLIAISKKYFKFIFIEVVPFVYLFFLFFGFSHGSWPISPEIATGCKFPPYQRAG